MRHFVVLVGAGFRSKHPALDAIPLDTSGEAWTSSADLRRSLKAVPTRCNTSVAGWPSLLPRGGNRCSSSIKLLSAANASTSRSRATRSRWRASSAICAARCACRRALAERLAIVRQPVTQVATLFHCTRVPSVTIFGWSSSTRRPSLPSPGPLAQLLVSLSPVICALGAAVFPASILPVD